MLILIVENGLISDFGKMENCPERNFDKTIDATGKMILPSWCDSHTHLFLQVIEKANL